MGQDLNKEQKEAVEHDKGPLLIIAGAGTGKTTVITKRIEHLILEEKINPSQILALTFTEKASFEMQERVDKTMPYGYTQLWISTFHAFCEQILRSTAIHIGLNPGFTLLSETDAILFLRKHLSEFDLKYFRPFGNPYKFLEGLHQHFSRLKDEDITPAEYLKYSKTKKEETKEEIEKIIELANAYGKYDELKAKEGVMDFSDLISNTLTLFRKRPNILKQYQKQFEYILVDEFQDTNYAQNEIARLLAGAKQNITVVGDDDQAIYRWRGAAISNIIQFRKYFKDARVITLTKNYRSTQTILDSSYKLIQNNNPDRLEIKEKVDKKLIAVRENKGQPIEFIFQPRVEDEAEKVADKILELVEENKINYKDVALLVRANDHSTSFIREFERRRIPYQFLGPGKLFLQEEIKDLIAYLKVLGNFEDSTSLYRVITMPIFELSPLEIASCLNLTKRKNYSLFETLEKVIYDQQELPFLKDSAKQKITKIVEMIKRHIKLAQKESAGQILYYFLEDCGLLKKLLDAQTEKEDRMVKNISKLFDKLKIFEVERKDASIFAVLEWIDLSMQMGESPLAGNVDWTENNAVNILTIHSSKGLEFSAVFLVNLVTNRFPTRERSEQIPIPGDLVKEILPDGDFHLEEERRLFYVGMTRAKDALYLTAAKYYGDGKRERKISPFVYETIGEKTIEEATKTKDEPTTNQLSLLEWSSQKSELDANYIQNRTPITYLSYSQIQTFEFCPLHYKLKYIVKVPTSPSPLQSLGVSVHNALRDYYDNIKNKKIPEDINLLLDKNWINEGYPDKFEEKRNLENAKKFLKEYFEIEENNTVNPIAVEHTFNFFINDLKVGGKIDRIDRLSDGRIEIVDYKTGKKPKDPKKAETDLQLTFYALAATEIKDELFGKKPEEVLLSLYFLDGGGKITATRTNDQLIEAKKTISDYAQKISQSTFGCSMNVFCKECEFKILCSTP